MKLICTFHTNEAAHEMHKRPETAGIAVISHIPPRIRPDSSPEYLLYAAIDEQHNDALQLLRDPTHNVRYRVDLKEFSEHMGDPANRLEANQTITRGLLWILFVLMLGVIVIGVLTVH